MLEGNNLYRSERMSWKPIQLEDLRILLRTSVDELLPATREAFERAAVGPYEVNCVRVSEAGPERVFVVARLANKVLIFDDVEDEFGVGSLTAEGGLLEWELEGSLETALAGLAETE